MTDRMKEILENVHRFHVDNLAYVNFGLEQETVYDALVVAPSYSPDKILKDARFQVTELGSRSYCTGFLVEKDGLKIAWIKTAAGGCNMLDYLLICGELHFQKLIFIGAVGALKPEFQIGEICTPSCSIAGTLANTYLKKSLRDYVPFEKVYPAPDFVRQVLELAEDKGIPVRQASVFCTDSIVMEYTHLEEIRAFGTDLIEMETATFYEIGRLMEVPSIALLVVSDNSATGVPLVGRDEQTERVYQHARSVLLPQLIERIVREIPSGGSEGER